MPEWSPISFDNVASGLWVVIALLLSAIGVRRGIHMGEGIPSRDHPPPDVEVAGALIDNKRVDVLIAALGGAELAMVDLRRAIERHTLVMEAHALGMAEGKRALDKNSEQAREVQEEAERLSRDMRELGDRLARSGR